MKIFGHTLVEMQDFLAFSSPEMVDSSPSQQQQKAAKVQNIYGISLFPGNCS